MDKRGVSVVVGYVLLITFGIIMGVMVYSYLKTYVPRQALECPDSISIFIKDYSCSLEELNFTIKNNGKFNLAGYFIYASNDSTVEVATLPMVSRLRGNLSDPSMAIGDGYVIFSKHDQMDYMIPKHEVKQFYNISNLNVEFIEIIPVRFQKFEGSPKLVSCGKAKIREEIICTN